MDNSIGILFNSLIEYTDKCLEDYNRLRVSLIDERNDKKINSVVYHYEERRLSKIIVICEQAKATLEELKDFRPSRVWISHEILDGVNSFLPLLEESDRIKITNVFAESVNSVRSKDRAQLDRIKKAFSKFSKLYNAAQQVSFQNFYKAQEHFFNENNYFIQFNFNNKSVNDEKFISSSDNHLFYMIEKLLVAGKLENKYVKNNFEIIKNAAISKNKAVFINDKIDELLDIKNDGSDIDFEKLKAILNNIKSNNQKIIQNSDNILSKFREEEIKEEYNKLLQEESKVRRHKESLESYEQLMYEYMIAEKQGNTEKLESLKSKLSELELSISSEEKKDINLKIEEKIKQEEYDRMQEIKEREKEYNETAEDNRKFRDLRNTAESNLERSGAIYRTEYTRARENGEFETIVDKEAREQQILDEIKRIEAEQNGQGGLKI